MILPPARCQLGLAGVHLESDLTESASLYFNFRLKKNLPPWMNTTFLIFLSSLFPFRHFIIHGRGYCTLQAAPPFMMDLTKMPRSAWFSLERLPLTLTPKPAEPESLRGISKVRNSLVPSGVRTNSSSSVFCKRRSKDWDMEPNLQSESNPTSDYKRTFENPPRQNHI